ncbi:hypothetical protein [Halorubrum sp. DTA98]|uniref:hypothetical protein n=1 Tax=Halorubrum sp. DTA98 TaxID=3402163 RepID=UPI003AAFC3A2
MSEHTDLIGIGGGTSGSSLLYTISSPNGTDKRSEPTGTDERSEPTGPDERSEPTGPDERAGPDGPDERASPASPGGPDGRTEPTDIAVGDRVVAYWTGLDRGWQALWFGLVIVVGQLVIQAF